MDNYKIARSWLPSKMLEWPVSLYSPAQGSSYVTDFMQSLVSLVILSLFGKRLTMTQQKKKKKSCHFITILRFVLCSSEGTRVFLVFVCCIVSYTAFLWWPRKEAGAELNQSLIKGHIQVCIQQSVCLCSLCSLGCIKVNMESLSRHIQAAHTITESYFGAIFITLKDYWVGICFYGYKSRYLGNSIVFMVLSFCID